MRATISTEAAIYVALGSTVALFVTLSFLALSVLREAEMDVARICGSRAAGAWTACLGAKHADGEPVRIEFNRPLAPRPNPHRADDPLAAPGPAFPADIARSQHQPALWDKAPGLIRAAMHKGPLYGARTEAAGPVDFQRLREGAVLIAVAAVGSGLLLGFLIRGSLAAEKAKTREVARANENMEASAEACTVDLQRALTTLRLHSTHVAAAVEDERARIAHDIHDDLGSILTALKFELSGVSGSAAEAARRPLVRRASTDLVDSAMQSVRRLIAALHPYPLERAGLWGALVWKAGDFEKSMGIKCSVFMSEDLPQPSKEISIAAFRIVEEALTNVARHARASAVEIVVHFVAGQLSIEVIDDGCGIANAGTPVKAVSYGLTGMRERAQAVDGALTIAARADHGTTVRFSVQDKKSVTPPSLHDKVS